MLLGCTLRGVRRLFSAGCADVSLEQGALLIRPPCMQVRNFQAIIGRETKEQCRAAWGGLPDVLLACIGGGSNAIGLFHDFVVRHMCTVHNRYIQSFPSIMAVECGALYIYSRAGLCVAPTTAFIEAGTTLVSELEPGRLSNAEGCWFEPGTAQRVSGLVTPLSAGRTE